VEWVRHQPGALDHTYVAVTGPVDPDDRRDDRSEPL
jgi:hypothetical protein